MALSVLRIGVVLDDFRQPFRDALRTAAKAGFQAVEINARGEIRPDLLSGTGLRQIRKWLDDARLRVCAVEFSTRRGYDVADDLERRLDATKAAMSMAYALGASVVVNSVGRIPEDRHADEWNLLTAALTELGRHGQKCGVVLAARTGAQAGEILANLLQSLPDGSLGVALDPGSLASNGFSATAALEVLGNDVTHVYARDGARDLSLGRGMEVPLGRGVVDFPTLLAKLEQLNYRGYFCVSRRNAREPAVELSNALQYLQALLS